MEDYLSEYGLALSLGGVVHVADPEKAANCYFYRNNMLIGALALFLADRMLARQRLAGIELSYLVNRRNYLNDEGARFLAKICGAEISPDHDFSYRNFTQEKLAILADIGLDKYYTTYNSYGEVCETYSSMRVEIETDTYEEDGKTHQLETHRFIGVTPSPWDDVLKEHPARLVMLATLRMFELEDILDYRQEKNRHKGFPEWDAGEALSHLADGGCLPVWGRIVATYPVSQGYY